MTTDIVATIDWMRWQHECQRAVVEPYCTPFKEGCFLPTWARSTFFTKEITKQTSLYCSYVRRKYPNFEDLMKAVLMDPDIDNPYLVSLF